MMDGPVKDNFEKILLNYKTRIRLDRQIRVFYPYLNIKLMRLLILLFCKKDIFIYNG